MKEWTLDGALAYIRTRQPGFASIGANLSLGGGVLNKGSSDHDLDIVVAPAKDKSPYLTSITQMIAAGAQITKIGKWNSAMILYSTVSDDRKIDWFIVTAGMAEV